MTRRRLAGIEYDHFLAHHTCGGEYLRAPFSDAYVCSKCNANIAGEDMDREIQHAKKHPGVLIRDCQDNNCKIRYVMES